MIEENAEKKERDGSLNAIWKTIVPQVLAQRNR